VLISSFYQSSPSLQPVEASLVVFDIQVLISFLIASSVKESPKEHREFQGI
jgi:steroid 5-alpha reductase family enzyme